MQENSSLFYCIMIGMEEKQAGTRLQKYLADCGVASRRKCEEMIAAGRVAVGGAVITEMGARVLPGDEVTVDGKPVRPAERRAYIAFYKPANVVTTAADPEGRKTVMAFFEGLNLRLFPVGRLDYETEGLLLMTNDGAWANRIAHPSFNLEKEYLAKVNGTVADGEVKALEAGVMLEGRRTWPAKVLDVRRGGRITQLRVVIHEGRNRQVRKMLEAVGHEVVYLKRVRIGAIPLGDSKPGEWRELTEEAIKSLGGGN
jgi:23S rRNA pseudouridine2605 synthase